VIKDEEDWSVFSPIAASLGHSASLSSSRLLASLGEYNVFSAVGSSIVFLEYPCLGKVGIAKFCAQKVQERKNLMRKELPGHSGSFKKDTTPDSEVGSLGQLNSCHR
jgi:hypothetical protein